jgi:hypothetical protein
VTRHVRLLVGTALAGVLAAPAAALATAPPTLALTRTTASWSPSRHRVFVVAAWAPGSRGTAVTVTVTRRGERLGRVRSGGWLLGKRTLELALPDVEPGDALAVKVAVRAGAQRDERTVAVAAD